MISMNKPTTDTVKFLCSYGGKILPRPSDGILRYVGGHTRVLSVVRSVSFSELIAKLSEMCGYSVALRCQLPKEEMDVLVSIKSDEDVSLIVDEYDRASLAAGKELKIRSVISPAKSQSRSNDSSQSSSFSYADLSPTKSSDGDHCHICCSTDLLLCFPPMSPPSPNRLLSDVRSGSALVRLPYIFDRDPNLCQPCHVQASYRPLVLLSNYKQ